MQEQQAGNLPDFIIIGAMKCGTTSLHKYLSLHPQISVSRKKELNFFIKERNWDRGLEWYKSHFSEKNQIQGESSPNYTDYSYWKGVPERMQSVIPDAKLIYILRDPIERTISHYIHKYANGSESRTIAEALESFENNSYVLRSRYYLQLEQYLKYFPSSQILIITSEELFINPHKTMQNIYNYLGVEDNFYWQDYRKRLHKSIDKRKKNSLGFFLSKLPVLNQVEELPPEIGFHVNKILYWLCSQKIERPTLDESLRNKLTDYFKEDINCLRDYTGSDFNEWCV